MASIRPGNSATWQLQCNPGQPSHPTIVLLDLGLRDTDGLSVLQTLNERHLETKVIVHSARDRSRFEPQALKLGAVLYLEKPTNCESIVSAVEGLACLCVPCTPPAAIEARSVSATTIRSAHDSSRRRVQLRRLARDANTL